MKVIYPIMGKDKCHTVNPTCYNSCSNRNAYDWMLRHWTSTICKEEWVS